MSVSSESAMALNIRSNVCEEERVYETPNSVEPFPYETPASDLQYETVLSHSTLRANEADDQNEFASLPVYEGLAPGGSSSLVYQYVPPKVSN